MQSLSDEGRGSAGEGAPADAQGLREGANGVAGVFLCLPGWSEPAASCQGLRVWSMDSMAFEVDGVSVRWSKWCLDEVRLSAKAQLLLLQGLRVHELFSGYFESRAGATVFGQLPGPFLYLEGSLSPPWQTPAVLKNVVVAHLPSTLTDKQMALAVARVTELCLKTT
jgi:hypothetical protein